MRDWEGTRMEMVKNTMGSRENKNCIVCMCMCLCPNQCQYLIEMEGRRCGSSGIM